MSYQIEWLFCADDEQILSKFNVFAFAAKSSLRTIKHCLKLLGVKLHKNRMHTLMTRSSFISFLASYFFVLSFKFSFVICHFMHSYAGATDFVIAFHALQCLNSKSCSRSQELHKLIQTSIYIITLDTNPLKKLHRCGEASSGIIFLLLRLPFRTFESVS